jgi:hypothetical protein
MPKDDYDPTKNSGKQPWTGICSPLQTQPMDGVFDRTGSTLPSSAAKPKH